MSETQTCYDTTFLILYLRKTKTSETYVAACNTYTWEKEATIGAWKHPDVTVATISDDITDRVIEDTLVRSVPGNPEKSYDNGCDSIATVHVSVFHTGNVVEEHLAQCGEYTWNTPKGNGKTYRQDITDNREESTSVALRNVTSEVNKIHTLSPSDLINKSESSTPTEAYCDSSVYLYLTIDTVYNSSTDNYKDSRYNVEKLVCDSLRWYYYKAEDANNKDAEMVSKRIEASADYTEYHFKTSRFKCDSVVNIKFTVHNTSHGDTNATESGTFDVNGKDDGTGIGHCSKFVWNGATYFETGNYDCNPGSYKNMYGCDSIVNIFVRIRPNETDTALNSPVCDSTQTIFVKGEEKIFYGDTVVETLRKVGKATTGCDSVYYLNVIVHHRIDSIDVQSVCDSIRWRGDLYTSDATVYVDKDDGGKKLITKDKCDSTITLRLAMRYSTSDTLPSLSGCNPMTWDSTGAYKEYTRSYDTARFTMTLPNSAGCDSLLVQPLRVYPTYQMYDTVNACDEYTDNIAGKTWRASTDQTFHVRSSAPVYSISGAFQGCDSAINMHVVIFNSDTSSTIDALGCEIYTWHGFGHDGRDTVFSHSFHSSKAPYVINTNPIKYHGGTVTNVLGQDGKPLHCDSAAMLHLTLYPHGRDTVSVTECDSFYWSMSKKTYHATAEDSAITRSILWRVYGKLSCDSITTLQLAVNNSSSKVFNVTACDRYVWDNNPSYTYYSSTKDKRIFRKGNTVGCDSVVSLNLTINNKSFSTETYDTCDRLTWRDGETYTASTTAPKDTIRNKSGCDSIISLNLKVRYSSYSVEYDTACDLYNWARKDNAIVNSISHTVKASEFLPAYCDTLAKANQHRCDSLIYLDVVINHSVRDAQLEITACDTFRWDKTGGEYTHSNLGEELVARPHFDTLTKDGCDSTLYLTLTINSSTTDTTDTVANVCGDYLWREHSLLQPVASNDTTYIVTSALPNQVGCDSILRLTVKIYPNDSLQELPPYVSPRTYLCDSLIWHDTILATTGTYYHVVPNAVNGICDSVYTISVNIRNSSLAEQHERTCNFYTWKGNDYTSSFDTVYKLQNNMRGCDSNVHLSVVIDDSVVVHRTIYPCDNYVWDSLPLSLNPWAGGKLPQTKVSTTWRGVFTRSLGCDSIVYLTVDMRHRDTTLFDTFSCGSFYWEYTDAVYRESTDMVVQNTLNSDGCLHFDHLKLTVYSVDNVYDTVHACDSYTWVDGKKYNADRVGPTVNLRSSHNCDSVVTLVLYMHKNIHAIDERVVCNNLVWYDGVDYREEYDGVNNSPQYVKPGVAAHECDSILTLKLSFRSENRVDVDTHTCDNAPLHWYNHIYDYPTTGLAVKPTAHSKGKDANGCDTLYTLNLTINPSSHQSFVRFACDSFVWHGHERTHRYVIGKYDVRRGENTFYDDYTNEYGCFSTDTLYLTLGKSDHLNLPLRTVCDSLRWDKNGVLYTASTDTATAVFTNRDHCDSVYTLRLKVNRSTEIPFYHEACDSVEYPIGSRKYYYSSTVFSHYEGDNVDQCPIYTRQYINVFPSYNYIDPHEVCDSMTWNDSLYTVTTTDVFSGKTVHECDSIVHLNLIVNYSQTNKFDTSVCDSYNWRGVLYTYDTIVKIRSVDEHGVERYTAAGCDIGDVLNLKVRYSTTFADSAIGCESYTWLDHGVFTTNYDTTFVTTLNTVGCDSFVHKVITIAQHERAVAETQNVCDVCNWYGKNYTASGTYYDTLPDCGAIRTLNLTIRKSESVVDSLHECDRYTWPRNREVYRTDTTVRMRLPNDAANGCPNYATLALTIGHSSSYSYEDVVCDSVSWHGYLLTIDTTITTVVYGGNAEHCDSTITMRLKVLRSSSSVQRATECDQYTWSNGVTYYESGTPTRKRTNSVGCDSIITLNLVIHYSDTVERIDTACNSYVWQGVTVYTSQSLSRRTYNESGCPRLEKVQLRMGYSTDVTDKPVVCDSLRWIDSVLYTTSTSAPVYHGKSSLGCDSIVRLYLKVKYSTSSEVVESACGSFLWHGTVYNESTTSATYVTTNSQGCNNTERLLLTIYPAGDFYDTVYACQSYTWQANGRTYTSTTLNDGVRTRSMYGCDSIVHLSVYIGNGPQNHSSDVTACDSFTWRGVTYTASQPAIVDSLSDRYGCDSVITLRLTVVHPSIDTLNAVTVCDSMVFSHGTMFASGFYADTVATAGVGGCDSIIVYPLTVNYSSYSHSNVSDCPGYLWRGMVFNSSVDTVVNLGVNSVGCDSVESIHFVVKEGTPVGETAVRACDSYTYNNVSFTTDTIFVKKSPLPGKLCDSVSIVRLYIYTTPRGVDSVTACDAYTWRNGVKYSSDNSTATFKAPSSSYCDSAITLKLHLLHSVATVTNAAAGSYYDWGDTTLYTSGTYRKTFVAANGCDSIVTLKFVLTDKPRPVLVCNDNKLLMVNHYPNGVNFGRIDYPAYRWYRNGVLIPNATDDYYSEYYYSQLNGCYYVEVAIDDDYEVWMASDVYCSDNQGIDDVDKAAMTFTLMPNPAVAGTNVAISTSLSDDELQRATLMVFDLQGRTLYSGAMQSAALPLSLSSGVYTVRLVDATGNVATQRLIVK